MPFSGVFKNYYFFLINKKILFSKNRNFCSTAEIINSAASNISAKNYVSNFYDSQNVKNIRKYQKSYLMNCPRYSSIVFPEFSFSSDSSHLFKKSYIDSQNNEAFDNFKKELLDLSYDEILEKIFLFLSSCQTPITEKQKRLAEILDNELLKREETFSKDDIFKILMILISKKTSYAKLLKFYWKKMYKLTYKLKACSLEQAVIYFYIYFKHSIIPTNAEKFDFLNAINNLIPQLNAQELGIVSLGLTTSNLNLSHPHLLDNFINRTISQIEYFTSEDIFCISNFIYKKARKNNYSLVLNWQEKLMLYLPNYEIYSLPSIALSGEKIQCLNFTLFDEIKRLLKENFADCNAAVINRVLKLFVSFNRKDDEFLQMAIKKFSENLDRCSDHLGKFVKYLICLGIYEKKLIEIVMSENYINYVLGSKKAACALDFLYVSCSLQIENSLCDVPAVDDTIFNKLQKNYYSFQNKIFAPSNICHWIQASYASCTRYPMKHFPLVFIMRLDKNFNIQPIPEEYISKKDKLLRPLNDDHFWIGIIITPGKQSADINCAMKTQCRQLKAIGYEPVQIYYSDWLDHFKKSQVKEYFEDRIITTLKKELNS